MDIKGANFVLTLSEEVRLIHILLRRVREGMCHMGFEQFLGLDILSKRNQMQGSTI